MAYKPIGLPGKFPNLQKRQIKFFADGSATRIGIPDSAAARGDDLDIDSELEAEMLDWATETVSLLKQSAIEKGFREGGNLVQNIAVGSILKSNNLYTLQVILSDDWRWAENGRGKGKRPPTQPIIEWIGRTPQVQNAFFNQPKWKGKVNPLYALARENRPMAFRQAAWLIGRSIGRKGTIKRFGYKGSKFVSSVYNQKYLNDFSKRISEKTGLQIAIYLSEI